MTIITEPDLPVIDVSASLNYIGVFLSFACNLNCRYCINDPAQAGERRAMIRNGRGEMRPELWRRALSRIPARPDLPITLQGGEPTLYWSGRGLGQLVHGLPHHFDLLTNLALEPERLALCFNGQQDKFRREAPYPSIRVSFHPGEMDRIWGRGLETLIARCESLTQLGFTVTPDKASSDVGIYLVNHPDNAPLVDAARVATRGRVPFEPKDFLGVHDGRLFGTYRYPYSTDLVARGLASQGLTAECRTSELLLDPLGFVWPCHLYLYETWMKAPPREAFDHLAATRFMVTDQIRNSLPHPPVGHILDPGFSTHDLSRFHSCQEYGRCIGCDTKVKNNRFQSLDDWNQSHTSVEIRNIKMPSALAATLPPDNLDTLRQAGVVTEAMDGGTGAPWGAP